MRFVAWLMGAGLLVCVGCQPTEDPLVQKSQKQYLTLECPTNATTISEMEGQAELPAEVTLAGRIYGGDFSPFDAQVATFTMIDLPTPGHNHEDPGDCPFCKHKADNAALAVVRFVGDDGQPLNVPADKLLGLAQNQDVVVRGFPTKVDDMLMVDATLVHLLSSDDAVALSKQFQLQRDAPEEELAVSVATAPEGGSPTD